MPLSRVAGRINRAHCYEMPRTQSSIEQMLPLPSPLLSSPFWIAVSLTVTLGTWSFPRLLVEAWHAVHDQQIRVE